MVSMCQSTVSHKITAFEIQGGGPDTIGVADSPIYLYTLSYFSKLEEGKLSLGWEIPGNPTTLP